MQTLTILAQPFVDAILGTAKRNVEADGFLTPVVFVQFANGERIVCPLKLPNTPDEKRRYFINLGCEFRQAGRIIQEALALLEGWYVDARTAASTLQFAPSQHPQRQEALVVIGRNAEQTRSTSVIQPFGRGDQNRPVWEAPAMAEYNVPASGACQPAGLVDYLFIQVERR